jgi:parallel beta-helix repeat protein
MRIAAEFEAKGMAMNESPNVRRFIISVMVALVALATSPLFANRASALPDGLLSHGPILINGDAGFTSANGVTSGSGTVVDLYVIDGWDINASSANGIEIRNTTAYFVIRNCYVHNGGSRGIWFFNVKNGKIDNNLFKNNSSGIYLEYYSDNNLVSNNIVGNSEYGIWIYRSDNNIISKNTCENSNYGILLYANSSYNLISNNTVDNNVHGINLSESDNNLISNNTVENNEVGILLHSSGNNFISKNMMMNNGSGIYLNSSDNNLVSNNTVDNSHQGAVYSIAVPPAGSGIYIYKSDNNLIFRNNFVNNINQAHDDGVNLWDNGYPSGGNYWGDHAGVDNYRGENQDMPGSDNIGDTPYIIPGGTNRDRYSLMNSIAEVQPGPSPEVLHEPPWGLIIGIIILATIIICVVVWYLLNLKKKGL